MSGSKESTGTACSCDDSSRADQGAPDTQQPASADTPAYRFRLYVAGDAPNSKLALANLAAICRASSPAPYSIDVVDVFKEPGRALADRIFMTPTLVRLEPLPACALVGNLSDALIAERVLGLRDFAA